MAKYHNFWKFLAKNTVSEINGKVPLFLELEFQKLEFLISFATVAPLSWICVIKKNYAVLEFGKLEYHATQYSSIPGSSTLKKKIYIFFLLFGDNQQINIKIKISSFFKDFIYLNRSIVKYKDFNFEI